MKKVLIAPSILSADFSRLGEEAKAVESAGADWLHVDVMDGHFVPNITIGPVVVKDLRRATALTIDAHLMISEPEKYIESFAKAGSDIITFHAESCDDPGKIIRMIKAHGVKAGISVKPATGCEIIQKIAGELDLILVMTVEPGFAGQAFMEDMLPKIKKIREFYKGDLEVDGGINKLTSRLAVGAGANALVAGTAVFSKPDYKEAIAELKRKETEVE